MLGTVEGTINDDVIDTGYAGDPEGETPTSSANVIFALEGNDTVLAGDGNDTVLGGLGNDLLNGDTGDDKLQGDEGDDTLVGDDGNDILRGGEGSDRIYGGAGADVITGGDDRDVIIGGTAGDSVDGGAGGDDLDVLDLTGLPPYVITDLVADSNGNGFNGTVVFVDANGTPTGEQFTFAEIEQIIEDEPNSDPVADPDNATTPPATLVTIDVLSNDTDPDGDTLTVTSASAPNGTVTINPDGTLNYTPNAGFVATDTITYTISDGNGGSATGQAMVSVIVPNGAPDAVDDGAATLVGVPVTISVLDNDTDPNGDPLTVTGADAPNGTVTVNPDGTISYVPNPGFIGADTITYTVDDGNGGTDTAIVTVRVDTPPPPPPVRDGTVLGTLGDDVIDTSYTGDPDGDRVDANDAILPGDTGNDDLILGRDGNDQILAGDGNDEIYGGTGNDEIIGGVGLDTLFGDDGNDTLRDRDGANIYDGGAGDDTLNAGGSAGNDVMYGGTGSDLINGGLGDDVIDSSDGGTGLFDNPYPPLPADAFPGDDRDTVLGWDGNDTIRTGDDADSITGGDGDDTIDAGIDDDAVRGDSGNDTIIGGEGNDTIQGNGGDDLIYGGLGPTAPDGLNIPDTAGDLVPDNGLDSIHGGDGNDTIYGMDDDDTIIGGGGNDLVYGGIDDDTINGAQADDSIFGDDGNDLLLGDTGNDTLTGGAGNDTLSGGNDRDLILGGNGGDTVDGGSGGDDFDVLDLTGAGVDFVTYTSPDREDGIVTFLDGTTMSFVEIENVVPCFTPGTAIATPRGERLVEELQVGDRIITRDNGIQEIRWVGHKDVSGKQLVGSPHLRPVMIKAGALGNGLPERDMLLSPNHRVLVANDRTQLYFEESEVLASAKHLVGAPGIFELDVMSTTYIHFMFDRHEVVLSNGAWTESFQPGDYSLKGLGNAQRNEILELFPELKTTDGLEGFQSARKSLKKHEARLLVR